MNRETGIKVLLTLLALEFFGPLVRDSDATHLFNPDWVGHARIHLAWFLGFMATTGLVVLYQIWGPMQRGRRNLWTALALEACLILGFWFSVVAEGYYGGAVAEEETHILILGVEENIFAFGVASLTWLVTAALLKGLTAAASDVGSPTS